MLGCFTSYSRTVFVFCADLVNAGKAKLIKKDTSKYTNEAERRKRNNAIPIGDANLVQHFRLIYFALNVVAVATLFNYKMYTNTVLHLLSGHESEVRIATVHFTNQESYPCRFHRHRNPRQFQRQR